MHLCVCVFRVFEYSWARVCVITWWFRWVAGWVSCPAQSSCFPPAWQWLDTTPGPADKHHWHEHTDCRTAKSTENDHACMCLCKMEGETLCTCAETIFACACVFMYSSTQACVWRCIQVWKIDLLSKLEKVTEIEKLWGSKTLNAFEIAIGWCWRKSPPSRSAVLESLQCSSETNTHK